MRPLCFTILTGCADGVLRFPEGSDPVRSAYVTTYELEGGGTEVLGIIANSYLLCSLPDSDDPAVLQQALVQQAAAVSREGARVLVFTLYPSDDSWLDTYEIYAGAAPGRPWDLQGVAGAAWWAILEAVVEEDDGLSVSYTSAAEPGSFVFNPAVEGPGEIEVTGWDETTLDLNFNLDTIDVSGRASATACDPDAALFTGLGFSQ